MIQRPSHLISVLQVYICVESLQEDEDFLGIICTFLTSSQLYLGLFKFLERNLLVIKENWHYFKVILRLFRVT